MEDSLRGSDTDASAAVYAQLQALMQSLSEGVSESTPMQAIIEEAVVTRLREYTSQVCAMLERTQDTLLLGNFVSNPTR